MDIPAERGHLFSVFPGGLGAVQSDLHPIRVDLGDQDQAAAGQGLPEIHVADATFPFQRVAHVLAQAQQHQGSQPFLAVKGRGIQHPLPAAAHHQAHDFPAQDTASHRHRFQKTVSSPQGIDHAAHRSGIRLLWLGDFIHIEKPPFFRYNT